MSISARVVEWSLFPIGICLRIVAEVREAIDALFGGPASLTEQARDTLEKGTLVRFSIEGHGFSGQVFGTNGDHVFIWYRLPECDWNFFASRKIYEIEYLH